MAMVDEDAGTAAEGATAESRGGVPASFETAWGLRERPVKGPRPGLSVEKIVAAGVAIAVRDGAAAVSMGRVARELGSSEMGLYRYLSAKGELLALMVDAALGAPPPNLLGDLPWREALRRWAWASFEGYQRNPWVVRIPITGPPLTPNQIRWLEAGLHPLRGTGLTEQEKASSVLMLGAQVRFQALMAADSAPQAGAGIANTGHAGTGAYGAILARLADPQHFPAVHAAIAAGALGEPPEQEFIAAHLTFTLERSLDGIEALIRARQKSDGSAGRGASRPT
jgi:AcrR family transcriptional regulator